MKPTPVKWPHLQHFQRAYDSAPKAEGAGKCAFQAKLACAVLIGHVRSLSILTLIHLRRCFVSPTERLGRQAPRNCVMTLRDLLAKSLEQSKICPTCRHNLVYICDCNGCRKDPNRDLHQVECTSCLAAKLMKSSNVPVHT